MIKEAIIQTRINGANRAHYSKLGYEGHHNELIDVKPEHLPPKSQVKVTAVCADCKCERKVAFHQYREYCPSCYNKGDRHPKYKHSIHYCECGAEKSKAAKCWDCYIKEVHNPNAVKRSNSDHRWSVEVRELANYECDCCGSTEDVCAHHLESFNDNEVLRRDVNNGVCVCRGCHLRFHRIYGFGGNTSEQYIEFKENYNGSN